jgi:cellulose synthase/poly-beta-1,6-N-acetylglucosamine synthase-like glycosyltransferase
MSAVVILPTTGAPEVRTAIESVLNQTYPTKLYLVCDGDQFKGKVKTIADEYLGNPNFRVCYLPVQMVFMAIVSMPPSHI